jgi:Calx-beta domain
MRALLALALMLAAPATAAAAPTASAPSSTTVAEDAGKATVTVTLSEPAGTTVRIPWRTASAAAYIADAPLATAGKEYTASTGELQFAPGATKRTLSVPILDDTVDDGSPFFAVEFHDAVGAGLESTRALVEIADDDPTPPASVADVQVVEGQGSALVPVTRPAVSLLGHAAYAFAPVPESARAGEDFAGALGRMSIAYGRLDAVARIPIVDDARHEETETFQVQLSPDTGPLRPLSGLFPGPVANSLATVTVADDDPVKPPPAIVTVSRVSGTVKLRGRALTKAARALKNAKVNATGGSARLVVTRAGRTIRSATVSGGAVRVLSSSALALAGPKVTIRSTGVSLRGDEVVTAPATAGARWTLEEIRRGTRVRVRRGRVSAGGRTLRAGGARTFR